MSKIKPRELFVDEDAYTGDDGATTEIVERRPSGHPRRRQQRTQVPEMLLDVGTATRPQQQSIPRQLDGDDGGDDDDEYWTNTMSAGTSNGNDDATQRPKRDH